MPSVFLVDDHVMIRRGIAGWFAELGFTVAGLAGTLGEARGFLSAAPPPDIIVIDIELGDENGLDLLDFIRERYRGAGPAALVCSVFEDPFRIRSALDRGARGYISKASGEQEFAAAVRALMAGGTYIPEGLKEKADNSENPYTLFTKREREVLMLVKKNYDNGRIAAALNLKLSTVENYISHLYEKTGLRYRGDLAEF
jgi:NarL family two-component system response regulator LiaR